MRFHGNVLQQGVHIDFHEADCQRLTLHRQLSVPDRIGDDHPLVGNGLILDKNARFRKRLIIKRVLTHFIPHTLVRRIDQAVFIHEGKALQVEKPLDPPLVIPQVVQIAQILIVQHFQGDPDYLDIAVQLVLHHLLPASGQFVQIQQTHGVRGVRRIPVGASRHQEDPPDQDHGEGSASEHRDQHRPVFAFAFHIPSLLTGFPSPLPRSALPSFDTDAPAPPAWTGGRSCPPAGCAAHPRQRRWRSGR